MKKLPISVALIAHNEAHNIRRCLNSVSSWTSEIIIVVNNCTDGTDIIAKEFGAKVFYEEWHGFGIQKNIALQHATEKWILCLDCDEEVSETLRESITSFIVNDNNTFNGAYFPRKVWFLNKWITHGDWYPDLSLRLLRNGTGKWTDNQQHEKMQIHGKTKKLSGDLHHYSNPTLNNQVQKIIPFSDMFLKGLLEKKAKWNPFNAIFRGFWRFFRCYFIRLGFLDGFAGFYIAIFQGFSTFYRYVKLYEHTCEQKISK